MAKETDQSLTKAKKVSELYAEIKHRVEVLKYLTAYKYFGVTYPNGIYRVDDESVVDIAIEAYCEVLDRKKLELDYLLNGEFNSLKENLSNVINKNK